MFKIIGYIDKEWSNHKYSFIHSGTISGCLGQKYIVLNKSLSLAKSFTFYDRKESCRYVGI